MMKNEERSISRREFIKRSSAGAATASGLSVLTRCAKPTGITESAKGKKEIGKSTPVGRGASGSNLSESPIVRRVLGKTGMEVSLLAFGGGSQFMKNDDTDAAATLERAVEAGVNYFDTCWNYGSERRFGEVLNNYRDQVYVATKMDARDGDTAKQQFNGSLSRLKMDYVDVLMMHGISKNDNLTTIENGVYKEMVKFKSEGTAKFIGFSVMQEADLPIARLLIDNLDIDVILGIINPTGRHGNCSPFLPFINEKNIGFMAMKTMRDMVNADTTARELIEYVLEKEGVTGAIIGHHGLDKLEENISIVKDYAANTSIDKDWSGSEERMEKFAAVHTPVWTLPGYRDGMMV